MKKALWAHHIPYFKGWEICFRYIIEKSDSFRIIFQGSPDVLESDEFLNAGKREFLSLPSLTISPYAGMENSIEVTGELNKAARDLFLAFMEPDSEHPPLWSYRFLKDHDVMLQVDDRTVAHIFLEESEVADLLALGLVVDGEHLEETDYFPAEAHHPAIQLESFSKEELSALSDNIRAAFVAYHENLPAPPSEASSDQPESQ